MAIIKPLRYQQWSRKRYIMCRLVALWILSFLFGLLDGFFLPYRDLVISMYVAVPCSFITMTVIYVKIYFAIRRQQRLEMLQNPRAKQNRHALKTTLLNLLLFILCWIPLPVVFVISLFTANEVIETTLVIMILALPCLNSIMDPLVYTIRLKTVRAIWRRTFCCLCQSKFRAEPRFHKGTRRIPQTTL